MCDWSFVGVGIGCDVWVMCVVNCTYWIIYVNTECEKKMCYRWEKALLYKFKHKYIVYFIRHVRLVTLSDVLYINICLIYVFLIKLLRL